MSIHDLKPVRVYKTNKTKIPKNKIRINPQPSQGAHPVSSQRGLKS